MTAWNTGQPQHMLEEASAFLELLDGESGHPSGTAQRLTEIARELEEGGTYHHTARELRLGARVAWRNSTQCVGKFYWNHLEVSDLRAARTADEVFEGLVEHLRRATNAGRTRLLLTVFAPAGADGAGPRVWNPQLVRYAGYRQPDGTVVGDPQSIALTQAVTRLGWRGAGTPFDLLPLVVELPGERPRWFELPSDAVLEVPIEHPHLAWFRDLGLRWHSHPAISNQRLEIGGLSYTLAPFSAWYTSAEIGARNLSDVTRYDMLPAIARGMGLDTRKSATFWRDRALLELTFAVQHSFEAHGVTILDHHAVARQFVLHEQREAQAGRPTPMDWRVLVPPLSGSTVPTFERHYPSDLLKPNFFTQSEPWAEPSTPHPAGCPMTARRA